MCHIQDKWVETFSYNMLLHGYELFHMLPHELISYMHTCFTKIITFLHVLGRENLLILEKVNKILCCLIESWDANVTAIFEFMDIYFYSIDHFLDSLIAYEQNILQKYIETYD